MRRLEKVVFLGAVNAAAMADPSLAAPLAVYFPELLHLNYVRRSQKELQKRKDLASLLNRLD